MTFQQRHCIAVINLTNDVKAQFVLTTVYAMSKSVCSPGDTASPLSPTMILSPGSCIAIYTPSYMQITPIESPVRFFIARCYDNAVYAVARCLFVRRSIRLSVPGRFYRHNCVYHHDCHIFIVLCYFVGLLSTIILWCTLLFSLLTDKLQQTSVPRSQRCVLAYVV